VWGSWGWKGVERWVELGEGGKVDGGEGEEEGGG
jgi:hypothetical protein